MHDYSVNNRDRDNLIYIMVVISAFVGPLLTLSMTKFSGWAKRTFPHLGLGYTSTVSSGVVFAIIYQLYDKWLWRIPGLNYLKIPNLNGKWKGNVRSSYDDYAKDYPIEIRIKQTFSQIEITLSNETSSSDSSMAVIYPSGTHPKLTYFYYNRPRNKSNEEMKAHPGVAELEIIDKETLHGDYFSGKHRLRTGEMTVKREK